MPHDKTKLTKREARFCVEYVNGYDRYKAYEKAGYKAKSKEAVAAAVSRLLKRPRVQAAIAELEEAIEKAALVTPERIIANVSAIAFDEVANKADRLRASELLGKNQDMWTPEQARRGGLVINIGRRPDEPEEPKNE